MITKMAKTKAPGLINEGTSAQTGGSSDPELLPQDRGAGEAATRARTSGRRWESIDRLGRRTLHRCSVQNIDEGELVERHRR